MSDPRHIRPEEVEIVVARELRKAGLALSFVRVLSRRALTPDDESEYAMELAGLTPLPPSSPPSGAVRRDVLIDFRNERRVTDVDAVRALSARAAPPAQATAADGPKRLQPTDQMSAPPIAQPADAAPAALPIRVMVSTTGFDVMAAREAHTLGVLLLRLADGGAAFLRSQWAMGDEPPGWVPEYMAEVADLGPTGDVRYQLITGPTRNLSA